MTAPTSADSRPLAQMPLFDSATLKCPYHYDRTLREQAPVYQDPASGVFVVSTYELVREAHKRDDIFSNEFALAAGSSSTVDPDIAAAMARTYNLGKGTLLTVDDPSTRPTATRSAISSWRKTWSATGPGSANWRSAWSTTFPRGSRTTLSRSFPGPFRCP